MPTDKTAKEALHLLIDAFSLPVGLGMASRTHSKQYARFLEQLTPELACKNPSTIRNNREGHTMQFVDRVQKCISQSLSRKLENPDDLDGDLFRRDGGSCGCLAGRSVWSWWWLRQVDLKLEHVWQLRVDLVAAACGGIFVQPDPELRGGSPCSSPGGPGLVMCAAPAAALRRWLDSGGCRIWPGSVGFGSLVLLAGGEICGGFCLVMARWLRGRCAG